MVCTFTGTSLEVLVNSQACHWRWGKAWQYESDECRSQTPLTTSQLQYLEPVILLLCEGPASNSCKILTQCWAQGKSHRNADHDYFLVLAFFFILTFHLSNHVKCSLKTRDDLNRFPILHTGTHTLGSQDTLQKLLVGEAMLSETLIILAWKQGQP